MSYNSRIQDSLTANLYRLIRHMRAQSMAEKRNSNLKKGLITATEIKKEEMGEKFPFLAIPDNPNVLTM